MTRKLHVQLSGVFLRCIINSAVQHLRTVQHNYSVVRVLCKVLVHCTVRTVQCTRTFLLHKSGEALSPDLSIGAFASLYSCTVLYTVQTRTVHLSSIYVPSAIESCPFSLRTYVPLAAGGDLIPKITVCRTTCISNYTYYYSYDNYTIIKLNLHTPKPPIIDVIRGQRRRAGARGIYATAASLTPAAIRVA